METMGVFDPAAKQIDANEYRAWLAEGNKPHPKDPDPVVVVDENEEKIKTTMRELAIENLKASGELPADYK